MSNIVRQTSPSATPTAVSDYQRQNDLLAALGLERAIDRDAELTNGGALGQRAQLRVSGEVPHDDDFVE